MHRVALRAAELAGTPRLLHATVDRAPIARVVRLLSRVRLLPTGTDPHGVDRWYSPADEITHRVVVRDVLPAKRRALRAHRSQAGGGLRTVALLSRLPWPLFGAVVGREWFVEQGAAPTGGTGGRSGRPVADVLVPA